MKRNPPTPWMTDRIKAEIQYRNKLRNYCNYAKNFKSDTYSALLRTQNNLVNSLISITKLSFLKNKLYTLSRRNDNRKLCREFRELGILNSKTPQSNQDFSPDELNVFFLIQLLHKYKLVSLRMRWQFLSVILAPCFPFLPSNLHNLHTYRLPT